MKKIERNISLLHSFCFAEELKIQKLDDLFQDKLLWLRVTQVV